PRGARELSFWRDELSGSPFTSQLPVDDPDLPEGAPQDTGEPITLVLPPGVHDGLRSLARRERATVFMTMLAAFGVLVQRYTGQEDLLLASVVANRNRTELEGLIGCFTKKVPLRLRLSGDPTFAEALARTRSALLGALSHQDLPFETVVQDTLAGPAAAHGLVPHVVLMFQGVTPRQELVLPGVETTGFETSTTARRTHFMAGGDDRSHGDSRAKTEDARGDEASPLPDSAMGGDSASRRLPWGGGLYLGTFLILSVAESGEELSCIARGAFHGPAVRRLMDSFRTLLSDIVSDPTRRLSELAVLDGHAEAEVLSRGRGPVEPLIAQTLHAALGERVRRGPDELAVRDRAAALTSAELNVRSNRLARHLLALGIGPGVRVGVTLESSLDAVVAVFAAWKVGAAWVGLDPRDEDDRLAWIIRDASVDVIVGDEARGPLALLTRIVSAEAGEDRAAMALPDAGVCPDDVAVIFYGSGPSAVPNGVELSHRALLNLLAGLRRDIHRWPDAAGPERRVCLSSPPTEDGFLRQLLAMLDGHLLYVTERALRADPNEAVSLLADGTIDLLDCAPGQLEALVSAGLQEALTVRDSPTEPVLVLGTRTAVSPEQWRTVRNLTGVRAHVLYGPPECAFAATARATAEASDRPVMGRPLANVTSHVLDVQGQPLPPRAVGELHLGGLSVSGSGRRHPTGQRARTLPEGDVELLGPTDAARDLRGFRVEPARLCSALDGCPGVREVAVALHSGSGGETRLVAYVVADGQPPTLAQLRT
ncbi:MAG: AMP-binding protein, partial [Actinomycetota bacterium]|nr:AMP-binding protein [Actinomycetota bacterium]